MKKTFLSLLVLLLIPLIPASAQFDVGAIASSKSSIHAPAAPTVTPTGFTPSSATASDTAAGGSLITGLSVTLSNGHIFNGTCGYGTPQSSTDPTGLTTLSSTSGGCNLNVNSSGYTSANDGTYQLTINPCQSGICLNPSSPNFTLTINSSACGSNIPAAACAGCLVSNGGSLSNGSCFNTIAMHMDFTGATPSFVGTTNPSFNATTLANWLDCAGAALPAMYANGFGHPSPGCFYSIISDAGSDSLLMSDPLGDTNGMELETANTSRTIGTAFPGEFYVQAKLRTDASSNSNCPAGTPCTDFWSYASYGGSPVIEYDFIEMYNGNTDAGGANAISPSSYTLEQHSFAAASPAGYSNLSYNTIGERITQDGSGSQSYCFYYNNIQVNAETYLSPTGNCGVRGPDSTILANLATPVDIILQALGASNGTINSYFKEVDVYTCSNWNQAQQPTNNGWACTGVLLTSNP